MSLKTFHIFFIVMAALLCVGFGVWCLQTHAVAAGIVSLAVVVGLVIFEVNFLQRTKGMK